MDVKVENLNFSKSVLSIFSSDIRSFAYPLIKPLNLDHFSYCRNYPEGKAYCLTTDPGFSEIFTNNKLYENVFLAPIELYEDGYYLWDMFVKNTQIGNALSENLKVNQGITIIRNSYPNYCEFYHFASKQDSPLINHFFINHFDVFENIIENFNETLSNCINFANSHRIIYPTFECIDEVFVSNERTTSVEISRYFPDVGLSKREKECSVYVKRGLPMKLIAERMSISPRTVEKHIAALKRKTNAKNMHDLSVRLNRVARRINAN